MTTSIKDLQERSKLPARQAGGSTLSEFFAANKGAIDAVLPKHIKPERMLKVALGAVRQVPQLQNCTTVSLFAACVQCAQLGLEPNTIMGHAYLVPFRNRKKNRDDVQVMVGYRGMLDLARRSGQIISIAAHEVCDHDHFEFSYGLDEKLEHTPADGDRGNVKGFYAVAKLVGGGYAYEYMTKADVNKVMEKSQSKGKYGPWKDHYVEMGRKTLIRRLFKYLPVSIEVATATALDGMASDGVDQNIEATLEGEFNVVQDDAPYGDDDDEEEGENGATVNAKKATAHTSSEPEWPKKFVDEDTGEEGWTDKTGAFFDPAKHGMKADGTPSITPSGNFRKRKRTAGTKVAEHGSSHNEAPEQQGESEDQPDGGADNANSDDNAPPSDDGFGDME